MLNAATPTAPQPMDGRDAVINEMAGLVRTRVAVTGSVVREDFIAQGFTEAQIDSYATAAIAIAHAGMTRDVTGKTLDYDRDARLRHAANCVLGLMPTRTVIVATLQAQGFTKREIDSLLAASLTLAGRRFARSAN